ncbi:GTPase domain-containing protein [soil metagenome]
MNITGAWAYISRLWSTDLPADKVEATLHSLRDKQPVPVYWLFGKTQSGKTSIIRYLTGETVAVIGSGFRPCTLTTQKYYFPLAEAPVIEFLDTRGVDDPQYDPAADIAAFHDAAHVMIVTVKITDFAQGTVISALKQIKADSPTRPVLLVLTCLHEALNGIPHDSPDALPILKRLEEEHAKAFGELITETVRIDLTKPEEGFPEPDYHGMELKQSLLNQLPEAYRQALEQNAEAVRLLKDLHQDHAGPIIAAYASMAASAAALPVPFVDLVLLPAVQAKMVYHLAGVYKQELSTTRFIELAGSLGVGLIARQAVREVAKLVPFVGSAVASALAFASTYALGRAMCLYFEQVHDGHVPDKDVLKTLYAEQFAAAKKRWMP